MQPNNPQTTDTFIINRRPPSQTPRGFGHFSQGNGPSRWIVIVGAILIIIACASLSGAAYLLLTSGDDDNQKIASEFTQEPPTATVFVVEAVTDEPSDTPEPSPTSSETPLVLPTSTPQADSRLTISTATFTFVPPSPIPPTKVPTATITPTITPTSTASDTPLPSVTPTHTPLVTNTQPPTLTASQTTIPPSPTRTLSPTPTQAQGRLVRLLYDENSFYAVNVSREDIPTAPFYFEAIDSSGVFAGYALYGTRWSQFYALLESTKCTALEITQASGWMRPTQCWDYNAILTPQRTSQFVFWLPRTNVTQFRVNYNEQEIARCEIASGQCDIYIP